MIEVFFMICKLFLQSAGHRGLLMVKCHLSTLMGMRKMNITDVAAATGLHRNTIAAFYHEKAERIELAALEKLCVLFDCKVGDILEFQPAGASEVSGSNQNHEKGREE